MSKVAISQSNYIPWKGFFDLIHDVDHFIFYDDVQFTKNDWRNRNRIKTASGVQWISIPVGDRLNRRICDVKLPEGWAAKHFEMLTQAYADAPYFRKYQDFLNYVYVEKQWTHLSDLNQYTIKTIAQDFLGIRTRFDDSREYTLKGRKLDRLKDLLTQVKADHYLTGPSAAGYLAASDLSPMKITLEFKDYSGYPAHDQLHPPFAHDVTILDLLFNTGPAASDFIWGAREKRRHIRSA